MPLHHRQGDLLFLRMPTDNDARASTFGQPVGKEVQWQDTLPAANLKARQSNVIVAGEATGHAHRLQAGTILEAPDGTLYLDIPHMTQVVHEEHGPITLEPGLWLVIRQREYHPQAIRTVAD